MRTFEYFNQILVDSMVVSWQIINWRHPQSIYQLQVGTSNFEYWDKVALDIFFDIKYSLPNKIKILSCRINRGDLILPIRLIQERFVCQRHQKLRSVKYAAVEFSANFSLFSSNCTCIWIHATCLIITSFVFNFQNFEGSSNFTDES